MPITGLKIGDRAFSPAGREVRVLDVRKANGRESVLVRFVNGVEREDRWFFTSALKLRRQEGGA
jgi:hypothetical protein